MSSLLVTGARERTTSRTDALLWSRDVGLLLSPHDHSERDSPSETIPA